MEGYDYSRKV
uniref:Uncharacterized protein n=1 Tax=Lepeophtheirus salmonis TaxID=72036 RepID=A0A0K2T3V1_LEPSM